MKRMAALLAVMGAMAAVVPAAAPAAPGDGNVRSCVAHLLVLRIC